MQTLHPWLEKLRQQQSGDNVHTAVYPLFEEAGFYHHWRCECVNVKLSGEKPFLFAVEC